MSCAETSRRLARNSLPDKACVSFGCRRRASITKEPSERHRLQRNAQSEYSTASECSKGETSPCASPRLGSNECSSVPVTEACLYSLRSQFAVSPLGISAFSNLASSIANQFSSKLRSSSGINEKRTPARPVSLAFTIFPAA
jgi:hypothetical protein